MTWLAWRQFRTQALVAAGALGLLALVMVPTGVHLRQIYDSSVVPCTNGTARGDCSITIQSFLRQYHQLQGWLGFLMAVIPALVGVFWGAPLVARELETGTYRLAWTQSVTRTRWLALKLAVVGLGSVVVCGVFSLGVTWWFSRMDQMVKDQFSTFDQRDLVVVGYAAFAFAVGVTAGVLIRRTLPSMVVTLVVFVTARLSFASWVRPDLLATRHLSQALDPNAMGFYSSNGGAMHLQPDPPNLPNAWVYTTSIVDRAGHALPTDVVTRTCPTLGAGLPPPPQPLGASKVIRGVVPGDVQSTLARCVTKLSAHYHELVIYQPASRYWTFQWFETTIFVAAAVILAGLSLWWVRHRLT
jgi:hypothetical protein